MSAKVFPIMCDERVTGHKSWIPWEVIAPHEAQAQRFHSQTLERLAERGGLAPCEAVAVIEGRDWRQMNQAEARLRLGELVADFIAARTAHPPASQTVEGWQPIATAPKGPFELMLFVPGLRAKAEAAVLAAHAEEARAKRLLSVGTVARELQVSLGTVRNWIKAGKLPAQRTLGGRYRVAASDMHAAKKAQYIQHAQP